MSAPTRTGAPKRAAKALATGRRVLLRFPESGDREPFLALRRASRTLHSRWEQRAPKGEDPYGPEAFARYLSASRAARKRRLLVCRREDGAIVGSLSLSEITRGAVQSAILGYWVGAPFAGRGYMREALALLARHAFEDLGLHRLEALILPENGASRRLAARAGFRLEGCSRRLVKLRGRWRDHERWALTVEDLRQRPQSRR